MSHAYELMHKTLSVTALETSTYDAAWINAVDRGV
jgi:hypothetical protein